MDIKYSMHCVTELGTAFFLFCVYDVSHSPPPNKEIDTMNNGHLPKTTASKDKMKNPSLLSDVFSFPSAMKLQDSNKIKVGSALGSEIGMDLQASSDVLHPFTCRCRRGAPFVCALVYLARILIRRSRLLETEQTFFSKDNQHSVRKEIRLQHVHKFRKQCNSGKGTIYFSFQAFASQKAAVYLMLHK